METIEIRFDGGCKPTNPGNKYGSFEVRLHGKRVYLESRKALGWGTNNEAEFEMLLLALDWTRRNLQREGFNPNRYRVEMLTDSTIVRNRVAGHNRTRKSEPQQRMFALASACLDQLKAFCSHRITWNPRGCNVALFGH